MRQRCGTDRPDLDPSAAIQPRQGVGVAVAAQVADQLRVGVAELTDGQLVGEPELRPLPRALGADDLAHLDVVEGDAIGNHGWDPFRRGVRRILGLEDDHRQAVIVALTTTACMRSLLLGDRVTPYHRPRAHPDRVVSLGLVEA